MKRIALILLLPAGMFVLMSLQDKKQTIPKKNMENGKKVYTTYCLACHQEDGTGVPRMNPPLVKTSYVTGDKKKLVEIILKGMDEQVEINGQVYSNVMAPHNFLSDQEVADVLTYIRNSFGNKASMVKSAEVKAVREKMKG